MKQVLSSLCLTIILLIAGAEAAGADVRLADAAQRRDAAGVASLLTQGVDVNTPQADGTSALHWAAHWNELEIAGRLLRAGARANAPNRYGITPLTLAAENGSARMLDALLKAGADPNAGGTGEPPLLTAARTGSADALKTLIAHGANVNATESWRGQTGLMWAAAGNHVDAIRVLVEAGAGLDVQSPGGFSALMFAARDGALDAARALVDAGANVNDVQGNGAGVLATAISNLNYELAVMLLGKGARAAVQDKAGSTPLHALVQARNPGAGQSVRMPRGSVDSLSLMKLLLTAGANPNARTGEVANRPTTERAILIDVGVNLGGATPLLLAARGADTAAIQLLVAHGADPAIATLEGVTPLMLAAGVGYVESSDAGANTETELRDTLTLLLALGVDINAASAHGQTALHGSVYRAINPIIRFLAERGARPDMKDEYGRTPLKLAEDGFNNMGHYRREEQAALLRTLFPN